MAADKKDITPIASTPNRILGFKANYMGKPTVTSSSSPDKRTGVYPFYSEKDNNFPDKLIAAYEQAPTHRAAIQLKHEATIGNGFIIYRKDGEAYDKDPRFEEWLYMVNSDGESLYQQFSRCTLDFVLIGNFATELNVTGKRWNVDHQDISDLRKAKKGDDMRIAICPDWQAKRKQIDYIDSFDAQSPNGKSIWYCSTYSPGRSVYSLPDYYTSGGYAWCLIEALIPSYNKSRIDNGFMPSALVTLVGEPPEGKSAEEYLYEFISRMTGEGNAGKVVAQLVSGEGQAPNVVEFSKEPEGIFTTLEALAVQNILTMHKINPSLLLQTPGKLSNASDIRTAYELMMTTSVLPLRKKMLNYFNKLVKYAGFEDYYLDIQDLKPVSVMDKLTELVSTAVIDINEAREQIGLPPLDDNNNGTDNN